MRLGIAIALVATAASAGAQSLEDHIASARGTVTFQMRTKDNVCGNGQSIFIADHDQLTPGWNERSRRRGIHVGRVERDAPDRCDIADARVIIDHDGRQVTRVRVRVGGPDERFDNELTGVSTGDAVRYLLATARNLGSNSADPAILGAVIADGPPVWQQLLALAKDNDASEPSRKSALFWVSHEAGKVAVAAVAGIAEDDSASLGVRSDALFYLAGRKNGEGIESLIKVVKTSQSKKLRKDAVWYLGQSRDPRAIKLFEELLAGK